MITNPFLNLNATKQHTTNFLITIGLLAFGLLTCVQASWAEAPLPVGSIAPDFNLPATHWPKGAKAPASTAKNVSLKSLQGKAVILVFYPKDQTHGCTIQLCALRDKWQEVQALNATVLASNPDSLESHLAFVKAQNYPFPILIDSEKTMATQYHTLGMLGFIDRTVYIIDGQGMIRYAKRGLPPVQELLDVLKKLPTSKQKTVQIKR